VSPLWLIPGGVVLLGGALIVALLRSAAEEAKLLTDELSRQREVTAAVRRLGGEVRRSDGPLRGRR
jgi:cytochrome c-type biogenesis protein CcmH/NrfF